MGGCIQHCCSQREKVDSDKDLKFLIDKKQNYKRQKQNHKYDSYNQVHNISKIMQDQSRLKQSIGTTATSYNCSQDFQNVNQMSLYQQKKQQQQNDINQQNNLFNYIEIDKSLEKQIQQNKNVLINEESYNNELSIIEEQLKQQQISNQSIIELDQKSKRSQKQKQNYYEDEEDDINQNSINHFQNNQQIINNIRQRDDSNFQNSQIQEFNDLFQSQNNNYEFISPDDSMQLEENKVEKEFKISIIDENNLLPDQVEYQQANQFNIQIGDFNIDDEIQKMYKQKYDQYIYKKFTPLKVDLNIDIDKSKKNQFSQRQKLKNKKFKNIINKQQSKSYSQNKISSSQAFLNSQSSYNLNKGRNLQAKNLQFNNTEQKFDKEEKNFWLFPLEKLRKSSLFSQYSDKIKYQLAKN